jgi:hypothetical protein
MIDVDARGRREAVLLREEAARMADTETALQSVLAGEVIAPLDTLRPVPSRRAVTRRRIPAFAGIAAAAAVVAAVLAYRLSNDPDVVTPPVTSSTELVVRPLDPPIRCEMERCPSLAVSEEGTLVAYDQAAKTLTWYDAEPHVVPVTADVDAGQVQLEAIGPYGEIYLLAGSPGAESWELVAIEASGEEIDRVASSSPDVEPSEDGLVERSCWSGCERPTQLLMPWAHGAPFGFTYPDVDPTSGVVTVRLGGQEWTIAWPYSLSTGSQFALRWDGGAVLSLVPESAEVPGELIELLPDGSVQRFGLGDEAVHVLLPDGSAVVRRDGQLVRLAPPRPAAPPAAWSAELTAHPLELPIACDRLPRPDCPQLAVSPDGTLVAYDPAAATLTWYEDEPRVVAITAELSGTDFDGDPALLTIGPHDVAYFLSWGPADLVAIAPTGAEITREPWSGGHESVLLPTASGLVAETCTFIKNRCTGGSEWPSPDAALAMPWVDLARNPTTDTRPYPVAKGTDAGIEVRFEERDWLLAGEAWSGRPRPAVFPRSDGGVVVLLDTFDEDAQPMQLLELLPDGTIERYFVDKFPVRAVLPDGSLIVDHNLDLVRLTPPA